MFPLSQCELVYGVRPQLCLTEIICIFEILNHYLYGIIKSNPLAQTQNWLRSCSTLSACCPRPHSHILFAIDSWIAFSAICSIVWVIRPDAPLHLLPLYRPTSLSYWFSRAFWNCFSNTLSIACIGWVETGDKLSTFQICTRTNVMNQCQWWALTNPTFFLISWSSSFKAE